MQKEHTPSRTNKIRTRVPRVDWRPMVARKNTKGSTEGDETTQDDTNNIKAREGAGEREREREREHKRRNKRERDSKDEQQNKQQRVLRCL